MSEPRQLRNFIAGEYVDGRTETTTDIVNPATGSVVATAPVSSSRRPTYRITAAYPPPGPPTTPLAPARCPRTRAAR